MSNAVVTQVGSSFIFPSVSSVQSIPSVSHQSPAIPSGSSEAQVRTTSTATTQSIRNPISSNIVVGTGSSFLMPEYDASSMSPEHFLRDVEEFLTWKNAERSMWLFLVGRVFPNDSDSSKWFRKSRTSFTDWRSFKDRFLAYEKSTQSIDTLLQKLFTKRH